jgi:hypothetical protein
MLDTLDKLKTCAAPPLHYALGLQALRMPGRIGLAPPFTLVPITVAFTGFVWTTSLLPTCDPITTRSASTASQNTSSWSVSGPIRDLLCKGGGPGRARAWQGGWRRAGAMAGRQQGRHHAPGCQHGRARACQRGGRQEAAARPRLCPRCASPLTSSCECTSTHVLASVFSCLRSSARPELSCRVGRKSMLQGIYIYTYIYIYMYICQPYSPARRGAGRRRE